MSAEETREQIMERLGITEEQVAEYLSHFPGARSARRPCAAPEETCQLCGKPTDQRTFLGPVCAECQEAPTGAKHPWGDRERGTRAVFVEGIRNGLRRAAAKITALNPPGDREPFAVPEHGQALRTAILVMSRSDVDVDTGTLANVHARFDVRSPDRAAPGSSPEAVRACLRCPCPALPNRDHCSDYCFRASLGSGEARAMELPKFRPPAVAGLASSAAAPLREAWDRLRTEIAMRVPNHLKSAQFYAALNDVEGGVRAAESSTGFTGETYSVTAEEFRWCLFGTRDRMQQVIDAARDLVPLLPKPGWSGHADPFVEPLAEAVREKLTRLDELTAVPFTSQAPEKKT